MDWNTVLSESGKIRQPSPLREAAQLIGRKDTINMCGGIPNPLLFPFESATFKLSDGNTVTLEPKDMEKALQYSVSTGLPDLVPELKKFIKKFHNPPKMENLDLIVTCGGQHGISNSLELIVSPGDCVIVPRFVFTGLLSVLIPCKAKLVFVDEDDKGINPSSLREVLNNSNGNKNNAPKVLYTIPNGCNPTGTTTSAERRNEIYKLAQEHNLIIIEDEAYYFLNYENVTQPSFLSLDTDGRVIHLDSFSKIISPGIRLGFICAPKAFVFKLNAYMQSTLQQAPSFTQMVLYKLLKAWNEEGFEQQIKKVRKFYKHRRDCMLASAEKWLKGLAEWNVPSGGMFLWMKVLGVKDTCRITKTALVEHGVGILPGVYFTDAVDVSSYIRISFSTCTPSEIDEAFQRLASVIKEDKLKPEMEKVSLMEYFSPCYNKK